MLALLRNMILKCTTTIMVLNLLISTIHFSETCLCSRNLYASWYSSNPYISAQEKDIIGIFPDFYSSMISTICGTCQAYSKTTVYFDRTKSGLSAKKLSESDLKSSVGISRLVISMHSSLFSYNLFYITTSVLSTIMFMHSCFSSHRFWLFGSYGQLSFAYTEYIYSHFLSFSISHRLCSVIGL